MQRWLVVGAMGAMLVGCGGGAPSTPGATGGPSLASPTAPSVPADSAPEPLVAKGHITDSSGRPLAGAVATADYQLSSDYSLDATTDANGNYRIALDPPNSSWHMSALYTTTWNGITYSFDLDPADDTPFVGADGGVRGFVWRLTGPTPEGDSTYGGTVYLYIDFTGNVAIDPQYIVTTLTPDGPLVDGSTGTVVTGTGDRIDDVAVGRYNVTADYREPGKAAVSLVIRVRNQGDFAPTVSGQFEQVSATGQQLELEVRSP